jgi:hypothetical protein
VRPRAEVRDPSDGVDLKARCDPKRVTLSVP